MTTPIALIAVFGMSSDSGPRLTHLHLRTVLRYLCMQLAPEWLPAAQGLRYGCTGEPSSALKG